MSVIQAPQILTRTWAFMEELLICSFLRHSASGLCQPQALA